MSSTTPPLKVALCHDYLIKYGGAERVLEALHEMWPDAPVFTLLYDKEAIGNRYDAWDIRTSFLQDKPLIKKGINYYRALMPQAVESFDLTGFDLVISDSSSFIKGVITQPGTLHVSYIHTPTRFLWFNVASHIERGKFVSIAKTAIPWVLHRIRQWDFLASVRPDILIANSAITQSRIKKFYRRDSRIVHPPVEIDRFDHNKRKAGDFYLIVSRLEPHKDIDVAIKACNKSRQKLKIVGTGTDEARLRHLAGSTIEFLGEISDEAIPSLFSEAKAFLAPQVEDFGITMVEALSAGCPVIAQNAGGAREIVVNGKTGILLDIMNTVTLADTLKGFAGDMYKPSDCREVAEKFSKDLFKKRIQEIIDTSWPRKDSLWN